MEGFVKNRRVSMLYELACEKMTMAIAKLSLWKLGAKCERVQQYSRLVIGNF